MSFNDRMDQWTQATLDRVYQIDPPFACHAQYALDDIAGQMQNCHTGELSPTVYLVPSSHSLVLQHLLALTEELEVVVSIPLQH